MLGWKKSKNVPASGWSGSHTVANDSALKAPLLFKFDQEGPLGTTLHIHNAACDKLFAKASAELE